MASTSNLRKIGAILNLSDDTALFKDSLLDSYDRGLLAPLPQDLEKVSGINAGSISKFLNKAKGALVGYSDDALRQMGKLDDVRDVVTRSGWRPQNWNKAITVGPKINPKTIPGQVLSTGRGAGGNLSIPGSSLDNKFNPLGWYTGGSAGWNVLKNRYAQGGLYGRGGIAHSTFAYNPRLGYNFKDLKSGRRLLPSKAAGGSWYKPSSWDKGSIIGTAGGTAREGLKIGVGVGVPAAALYGAFNPEEGDERGFGQRLGGAVGSTLGTYASWPLGAMSYAPSMVAPFVTDNKKVQSVAEAISPWGLGEYAGELIGSGGMRKEYDPEEYQRKKYEQEMYLRSLQAQQYAMSVPPPQIPRGLQYTMRRNSGTVGLPYEGRLRYGYGGMPPGYQMTTNRRHYVQPQLPRGLNY
jgi:hypothetical protein